MIYSGVNIISSNTFYVTKEQETELRKFLFEAGDWVRSGTVIGNYVFFRGHWLKDEEIKIVVITGEL